MMGKRKENGAVVHQLESVGATDSLGQIRQILLGQHQKQIDERLDAMEASLQNAVSILRSDTATQIAELDTRLTAELDKLKSESEAAREQQKNSLHSALESAAQKNQDYIDHTKQELSVLMRTEVEALQTEIQRVHEKLRAALDEGSGTRTQLAVLLRSLADEVDHKPT